MQKIPSLFQRDYAGDRCVLDAVVPGSEWVLAGEGVATRKFDGTCCMVRDGKLYRRYDAKQGKTPPAGFEPAQEPDAKTGHWPGWLLVGDGKNDALHREAWANAGLALPNGTYELCGPKIQNNPEKFEQHVLIRHGCEPIDPPRTFQGLREWLRDKPIEGIVWHHTDGRMVKIKRKDFTK